MLSSECEVEGCEKARSARGLCIAHYTKFRRYGDPTGRYVSRRNPCSVDGFDRPSSAAGYCAMHHGRFVKHGDPLVVLRRRGIQRDEQGRKMCVRCREWCDLTLFGQNKRNADGLGSYCKPCNRIYQRIRKFGVDATAFALLLKQQGGGCAICLSTDSGPRGWHVDHDHDCCPHDRSAVTCGKCVRGLLCHSCNLALGGMKDDPIRLRAAADYLERAMTKRAVA